MGPSLTSENRLETLLQGVFGPMYKVRVIKRHDTMETNVLIREEFFGVVAKIGLPEDWLYEAGSLNNLARSIVDEVIPGMQRAVEERYAEGKEHR